jgi:hypothetical protein
VKKIVWGLGLTALALWSLLTWGTYALVTGAGDFVAANADLVAAWPEWQYWLQWSLRLVEAFGVALLWAIWGVGALFIVGGTWLVGRLTASAQRFRTLATRPV